MRNEAFEKMKDQIQRGMSQQVICVTATAAYVRECSVGLAATRTGPSMKTWAWRRAAL